MKIFREKGNDVNIEEITNGYIIRYQFIELGETEDDYDYGSACQYFETLDGVIESTKAFYDLQIFKR